MMTETEAAATGLCGKSCIGGNDPWPHGEGKKKYYAGILIVELICVENLSAIGIVFLLCKPTGAD